MSRRLAPPPSTTSPYSFPGLWGGEDFPFQTRAEFVEAIESGGVAGPWRSWPATCDLLGLYTARSLPGYDGVEYELIEHQLTDEQRHIYDLRRCRLAVIHGT